MVRHPGTGRARQRGFFDFSFTELVITFGVALVVLGPKKLPGLVSQVGRWMGRARIMARQFREQLEQEVNSVNNAANVTKPAPPPPATNAAGQTPDSVTSPEAAAADAPQSFHEDSPTHFKLDGSTPAVSYSNPLDDAADEAATAARPVRPPPAEATAPAQDAPAAKP